MSEICSPRASLVTVASMTIDFDYFYLMPTSNFPFYSMNGHNHTPNGQPEELDFQPSEELGPDEIFLDDDDVAELKAQMDEEGDVPMDEDEDDIIDATNDDDEDEEADAEAEEPLQDTSLRKFTSHRQPVFSVSTHPTCPILAVSGGEDDNGYIWRLDTGEEIAKLTGHTDSVITTGWSADGELVATGGMDGRVRVWRRVKSESQSQWEWARWEFLTVLEGMDEITASHIFRTNKCFLLSSSYTVARLAS